ncbi:hypothetical protein [Agrobacterium larrymoorei]|uniref:Uncharacterized protein n=1 Tax=Agrobacterium larrymoorei TaxID=160699 RepID=A0ABU0UKT4_9HYPH|nr:hypothetical protein [Agrobacterium larrymoorei]MDQ1185423.1 hypothetical protein [Agrobacterium larrymoorei]
MTERLNSNAATFDGASFSPANDFTVQADIPSGSKAKVEVEGRVDANAPWVSLGNIIASTSPPILRFARCPFARVRLLRNDDLKQIKAWSSE